MIRFDRVAKRYAPDSEALTDISVEIAAGELVTLEGSSGAGKSTLLKLIPAIERPTGGALLVHGQNVGALPRGALPWFRRNMGLVFQDHKLLPDRSALDNILLTLEINGYAPKEARQRAQAALDKAGLALRAQSLPGALSGGERQRLAVARAVAHRPALLIADAPTDASDPATAAALAAILCEFHRAGVTVLIATGAAALFPGARRLRLECGRLI